MALEVVTKDDLEFFRIRLLNDIRQLLQEFCEKEPVPLKGYKTKDVRKIFGCSVNTLQSWRIAGKLRRKKVGGTYYYNKDDVQKLMNEGF